MDFKNNLKKYAFIYFFLVIAFIYIFLRGSYTVYRSIKLETAKEIMIEYNIIDNEILNEEYINKESFITAYMRVLGADDETARWSDEGCYYETLMGNNEEADRKEAGNRYGYFKCAFYTMNINSIIEREERVYPKKIITISQALDYIRYSRGYPDENNLMDDLNFIGGNIVTGGYRKLKREDCIFLLYNLMNKERVYYIDQEKRFDSKYTHEYYPTGVWSRFDDEYGQKTYLEMHKEKVE